MDVQHQTEELEMLNICADFYQELCSSKTQYPQPDSSTSSDQMEIPEIMTEEVELAIKQMKDNKAPDIDDHSSDV